MLLSRLLVMFLVVYASAVDLDGSIQGTYTVEMGHHYTSKGVIPWGFTTQKSIRTKIVFGESCAIYNMTTTSSYTCSVDNWYADWNKLWGKQRCGVFHGIHEDSDRFVFRRCSDFTCPTWDRASPSIELAAYAYDDGHKPYDGTKPGLLKPFSNVVVPNVAYLLEIADDDSGNVSYSLYSDTGALIETQVIVHTKTCKNAAAGALDGLYCGGPCVAPVPLTVTYIAVASDNS